VPKGAAGLRFCFGFLGPDPINSLQQAHTELLLRQIKYALFSDTQALADADFGVRGTFEVEIV